MNAEWTTVYQARTLEEADIIVAWLDAQGIRAQVPDRHTVGTFDGLAPALLDIRIEVAADQAQAARQLLDSRPHSHPAGPPGATVEATCEDCGATSVFPFESQGQVEDCPRCGRFLDVPPAPNPAAPDPAEH